MRIRRVDIGAYPIVDLQNRDRSGVHLSSIISYMNVSLGKFKEKDLSEYDFHLFKFGVSWEAAVLNEGITLDTLAHHSHLIPGFKMTKDGISMTTDAVDFDCGFVVESKSTMYGTSRGMEDPVFKHYHWQGMSYAHAAKLKRVLYPFCHIYGDHKENRRPIFQGYEATYSNVELVRNWDMIRRERDNYLKSLKNK